MQRPPIMDDVERVVVYRLGSIGDAVVALPFFHRLTQLYPQAEKIVLTNAPISALAAPMASILGYGPLVSKYIAYPLQLRSVNQIRKLRSELRRQRASVLIYMAASRGLASAWRDLTFFRLCGFRQVIGIPLNQDLQRNRVDPSTGEIEPECERLARALWQLGPINLHDARMWDLLLTPEELARGQQIVANFKEQKFVAIHAGGKTLQKDWGADKWLSLLATLGPELGDCGLLVVGAVEDSPRYEVITATWPSTVINICGKATPRESVAAMQYARLFVGHDSGPLHLASVCQVPSIGLFGDLNKPKKWHPYVGMRSIIHNVNGIQHITVAEVTETFRDLYARSESNCEGTVPCAR